ncbi:PREDICTED: LIM domain only protein 7 isoform X5 [Cyprinodon variegatus]|uniref:LIM domain only protein 7 isoform X5 n=1 Tax=Cyprinodon variegatus TaxID=28743 RepID=UPI0007428C00|nr:PREDICTED: LIM domain only protein 7 isoform X5 [Cyprinodon variegatus]
MEWRQQSSVSSEEAYLEAQRWMEAVTKKKFGNGDFRSALENGVLLCDLINKIKPGIIKRVNRLPTPIAGLDNLNVFLKACGKLGLKEAQLFHPGDLQDLSTRVTVKHQETNRRLKNVLITIYWLGRRAQSDRFYDGPYLNFKAFEGLLGTALYKALQESNNPKGSNVRDSGFGDSWYSEREEIYSLREGGGGGKHRRDDSFDSLDSLGSRPHSASSDANLKGSSEGCSSDTEADSSFRMADKNSLSYRRSLVITPKVTAQFNQFLPTKDKQSGYVPAPLRKKRAERNEDSRRSWASSSFGDDEGTLTRQQQTPESSDGSKSTSDIQVDPSVTRQNRFEELQKYREQIKDSEDKWQDDLNKWKNRRRSVNSDIVKKKEEREKIEQITYGGEKRSKTFKEMQEERDNKGKSSIGSRLSSLSHLDDDEDVFDRPAVRTPTRTLAARSYTIDTPSYSSESYKPSVKAEEPPAASPPTRRSPSPPSSPETVDSPAVRNSITSSTITPANHSSHSQPAAPLQKSPAETSAGGTSREKAARDGAPASSTSTQKEPESRPSLLGAKTEVAVPSFSSINRQRPQFSSMEPNPPGGSRVSASLPRSYQRSDSARLSSVVAPRPFGTQSSRISSLSRAYTTDDSHKGVNGNVDLSKKASVPGRYHQYMNSGDEDQSSSSPTSDEEEEEEEKKDTTVKGLSSTPSIKADLPPVKSDVPVSPTPKKETSKEAFCEMRISLNQKPNSSRDFGFQAAWDSTGARVTSIQPGSSAEMCQLQVGDEVLKVNGLPVAQMSYDQWKSSLDEALQKGSLVMDVRRHGQNNWDRDQPSLPFKSHKTVNLTSTDHPILLGSPETKTVSSSLDFTSRTVTETVLAKEPPTLPLVDVASDKVNGDFRHEPVTMRNKESEPISLKNFKRRSEFFEQGGSESSVPDIPVPPITPTSSSRWSWDPEEERKRQEKWQKEQERLLQEKYKRDQEKLQEEWLKAQQEIVTSGGDQQQPRSLQVNHGVSPQSPPSSVQQPTPTLWEEEEKQRKMEQERQRQAAERRRREIQEEEERKRREEREEELRMQRMKDEELRRKEEAREQERRQLEAAEQQRRQKAFEQQRWAKSQSSPQLDEDDKPQRRDAVTGSGASEKKSQQSLSQAELERQQILNEMKKKTPLLTDNSWIRQRAASTAINRESEVPPMRRGESLDNLDSYNTRHSSWTARSNSFAPNYSRPYSGYSGNSSFYSGVSGGRRAVSSTLPSSYSTDSLRGGAGTHPAPWSRTPLSPSTPSPTVSPDLTSEAYQQRNRSVSGRKICTFCDTPLGKGAAMIIESLGLCYHLNCFKCIDCKSDLGGTEAGAEVRIRNKQLYCNTCYMRFKTGQPSAM